MVPSLNPGRAAAKTALPVPCLCLVTDRSLCPEGSLVRRVLQAVSGGVNVVQLREKDLPGGPLLEIARALQRRIAGRALLMVNERIDVAIAAGADGVHLGEASMPLAQARRIVGDRMLIGRSVHSVPAALQAREDGADYLIVGTVFPSRSHPGQFPQGLPLLRRVAAEVSIPFLGIGGISAGNAAEVLATGASGAAVISSILGSDDPERAARSLSEALAAVPAAGTRG